MNGFGWFGYNSNRIGRHSAWVKSSTKFYAFKVPFKAQLVKP
jgi:hypothetical protein